MSDKSITMIYYTVSDFTVVLHLRHKQIQCTMKFSSKNLNYSFRGKEILNIFMNTHMRLVLLKKCVHTQKNRHNKKAQKC